MIAVEPEAELGEQFDAAGGKGKPRIGQLPICWDPYRDEAIDRAHDQFRWFGGGWKVNAELPGTSAFAAATQFVRTRGRRRVDSVRSGRRRARARRCREFVDAGFTDVAVVQIGGDTQPEFLEWAEREFLPGRRSL